MDLINGKYKILNCLKQDDNYSEYIALDIMGKGKKVLLYLINYNNNTKPFIEYCSKNFYEITSYKQKNIMQVFEFNVVETIDENHIEEMLFLYTTEYIESINLIDLNDSFNEYQILDTYKQLATVLDFLHFHGIIYKYLGVETIKIIKNKEKTSVKLLDLISLKRMEILKEYLHPLTCTFLPPEFGSRIKLDYSTDIYSLGNLLYYLLTLEQIDIKDFNLGIKNKMNTNRIKEGLFNIIKTMSCKEINMRYKTIHECNDHIKKTYKLDEPIENIKDIDNLNFQNSIIGRDYEIKQILDICEIKNGKLKKFNKNAVLINGDKGIGKTRLINEVKTLLNLKRCKSYGTSINKEINTFRKVIGIILKQFIKKAPESILEKYENEIIKLVPELGFNKKIIPSSVLPNEQEELKLYNRVANFILDVSSIQPSILYIDDLHLGDKSIMKFIEYFLNLNKVKNSPILTILSYENEAYYYNKSKKYIERWSLDNTVNIKLSRLTVEEIADMTKHILGWRKDPLNFATRIMEDTEGLPFSIEEVTKELYSQGILEFNYSNQYRGFAPSVKIDDYHKIIISKNIDESILKQLKSLNETTREILNVISLFNTAVSQDIIMKILEIDSCDEYFSKLLGLKILNKKFDDWGYTYGFHSKYFKNHIYNSIEESKRLILHRKASNILEKLYIEENRKNKGELIYQLIQSNQTYKAANYCIEAGTEMLELFIYEQSRSFFKQAYKLLERNADAKKLKVLMYLGEVNHNLLENKEAIYYYNQAIKLADLQKETKKTIDIKTKIGLIYYTHNEFNTAEVYLNESIKHSHEIKYSKGVMQAAYALSKVYMNIRELKKMKEISEVYFNYAYKRKDLYYMGVFTTSKGVVEYFNQNINYALTLFKRSVNYLEKADSMEEIVRPINNIGVIFGDHFQDHKNARRYFEKGLKVARQYRKTSSIITFVNNIADTYVEENDYAKAIEILEKNLDLALEYEEEISILLAYSNLIIAYTSIGEYNQAYVYLLKADIIYQNRDYNHKGIYLETYLEARTRLYMAMGDYQEAIETTEDFFKEFYQTGPLTQLRMKKLKYFAEYYAGKPVNHRELVELINEYRETPYIRDLRTILLKVADYFISKSMDLEAKLYLDEDKCLIDKINNDYFRLQRKYLESFFLNEKNQIDVLEEILLNSKLNDFKEMRWQIHSQLGKIYLKHNFYFKSINNFLSALDNIYILFNSLPFEFKKLYLLKDEKFLIRMNLLRINKLINNETSKKIIDEKDKVYNKYKNLLINESDLENFFNIFELQDIFKNESFNHMILKSYDEVNKIKIKNKEELLIGFTDDSSQNLNFLLQLLCRTTLASRGAIISKDERKIITSLGDNIPQYKINSLLEAFTLNREIFNNNSIIDPSEIFSRDDFSKDIRSLICLPIYTKSQINNIQKDKRDQDNKVREKIIGYLYLETNKALNNFSNDSLRFCENLMPLAGILLSNYNLSVFSSIDKMTQTYTRKYFEQIFNEQIEYAKGASQSFSIIMLDIDHFKNVNDTYGHQKGDMVLTRIGKIIKENIRSTDYVGRYGGEEFILLLPGANKKGAYKVAEKIRKKVEKSNFFEDNNKLTISCGISTFPYDSDQQNKMVEKADQALYNAKESGRNKSIMWSENITLKSKRVDKLAGIVTGNIVQDQRNVLVITETLELATKDTTFTDKIFTVIGRLIEILEAEEGAVITINNNKVQKKYYRKRFQEDWSNPFKINENLIKDVILSKEGKYIIDWENIDDIDMLSNTPNWKSVIITPVIVNEKTCGLIYLSVPIKEKEFDYDDYNLANIISNATGMFLNII